MANNKKDENSNSETKWILVLVGVLVVILVIVAIFYLSGNPKFKFMKRRVARPNAQGVPKIRRPRYENIYPRTSPGIRYL